jgi:hypothetical protein
VAEVATAVVAEVATAVVAAAAIWGAASVAVAVTWAADLAAVMSAADLAARISAADLEEWRWAAREPLPPAMVAGCTAPTTAARISAVTYGAGTNGTLSTGIIRAAITTTGTTTAAPTTRPITGRIHGVATSEPWIVGSKHPSPRTWKSPLQTNHTQSEIQARTSV